MDLASLLIQLVSGMAGGNIGGAVCRTRSMGPPWNTILGATVGLLPTLGAGLFNKQKGAPAT